MKTVDAKIIVNHLEQAKYVAEKSLKEEKNDLMKSALKNLIRILENNIFVFSGK